MSTFFNIQSITVPAWIHDVNTNPIHSRNILTFVVASWISVSFGVLGTGALFVRMLERKIKWATRLMLLGAFFQGLLAFATSFTLIIWSISSEFDDDLPLRYSEGIVFGTLGAFSSLAVAGMGFYQLHLNRGQLYEWTLYHLSPSQRQVTLLLITTVTYIVTAGLLYSSIEGWDFDDATYWAVVTFTTIGFGDLVPRTALGKLLLPVFASIGVIFVAFNIYAVREVALELITLQLAEYFSKHFSSAGLANSESNSTGGPPLRSHSTSDERSWGLSRHPSRRNRYSRARSMSVDATSSSTSVIEETASTSAPSLYGLDSSLDVGGGGISSKANLVAFADDASVMSHDAAEGEDESPLLPRTPQRRKASSRQNRLARASTTSALLVPPGVGGGAGPRTLLLSRGANFPNLTITGDYSTLRRRLVVDVTQETFQRGITNALAVVLANTFFFGALFAYFEKWNFLEGLYFTYIALMSIGYGDYVPRTVQSRSIFIWFIFIGVASITYLGSLLAERALNQWTLTVKLIERRVDRYERKARMKKLYKKDQEAAAAAAIPNKKSREAASTSGSQIPLLSNSSAARSGVRRRRRKGYDEVLNDDSRQFVDDTEEEDGGELEKVGIEDEPRNDAFDAGHAVIHDDRPRASAGSSVQSSEQTDRAGPSRNPDVLLPESRVSRSMDEPRLSSQEEILCRDRSTLSASPTAESQLVSSPVPLPTIPATGSKTPPPQSLPSQSPSGSSPRKGIIQRGQTIHIDAGTGTVRVSPRLGPAKSSGVLRRLFNASRSPSSAIAPAGSLPLEGFARFTSRGAGRGSAADNTSNSEENVSSAALLEQGEAGGGQASSAPVDALHSGIIAGKANRRSWGGFFGSGSLAPQFREGFNGGTGRSRGDLSTEHHAASGDHPRRSTKSLHHDEYDDTYDDEDESDAGHDDYDVLSDSDDEHTSASRPNRANLAGAASSSTGSGAGGRSAGPVRIFTARKRRSTLMGGATFASLPVSTLSFSSSSLLQRDLHDAATDESSPLIRKQ
ncbi:Potassium channel [Dinochytrium kinnereticum]|nr:Potassium channel [Dinochytrium kinnereticum]